MKTDYDSVGLVIRIVAGILAVIGLIFVIVGYIRKDNTRLVVISGAVCGVVLLWEVVFMALIVAIIIAALIGWLTNT